MPYNGYMSDSLRLETVEIKLAHLERSLQELGQTVVRQQREIAAIRARHRELQQQLEALEGNEAQSEDPFEKPPHY